MTTTRFLTRKSRLYTTLKKNRFALDEEARLAYYITVPVVPSAADLQKADKFLARVDSALHASQGLEGVRQFNELSINERKARQSELASLGMDAKQFADSAAVGQISKSTLAATTAPSTVSSLRTRKSTL